MDGKTIQRIRKTEQENAALKNQNTELSAAVLQMGARLEETHKALSIDRLLIACLLRCANDAIEVPVAIVDKIKDDMATPPGMSYNLTKDDERGVWVIELHANEPPPATEEVPGQMEGYPPSVEIKPAEPITIGADGSLVH